MDTRKIRRFLAAIFLNFANFSATVATVLIGAQRLEAQEIYLTHPGNHVESWRIVIDGKIEAGLTIRLKALLEQEGGAGFFIVALNSPGGDLIEGLELGSFIREQALWTTVEKLERGGQDDIWTSEGTCASACAYAFLGGENRELYEDAKLGFHRFYRAGSLDSLINNKTTEREVSGNAQLASAFLIQYLTELGDIDPKILLLAAGTPPDEMYWVSNEEASELGITTEVQWSRFWLEPFKNGIIAASRREGAEDGYDAFYAYDRVAQATAFCRGNARYLMFSVPSRLNIEPQEHEVEWTFRSLAGTELQFTQRGDFSLRGDQNKGWIDILVSEQIQLAISQSSKIGISIWTSRADGWDFKFESELDVSDRENIAAAYRFCIG